MTESSDVQLRGFPAVAASIFAQTGQVPAAMLLMEVADRLPEGNVVKRLIQNVITEANEGVQVVMAKIKEEQGKRIVEVDANGAEK